MGESLKLFDELIRGNNLSIFKAVTNCRNGNRIEVRLRADQIRRMNQGLCYYLPARNQAISFLEMALINHPFFHLVSSVSKRFSLDVLKSFYIVREVHESQGKIPKNITFSSKV